jgi:putative transcriptional regulator
MSDRDTSSQGRASRRRARDPGDRLDLTGKLLIAMPAMGDARFVRAVVFICAHSEDGAMGLIINKPVADLRLRGVLEQVGVTVAPGVPERPVHFGGPVETARGFVLHSGDYRSRVTTLPVTDQFGMTATVDVLEDIGAGHGPVLSIVALGYAGWGAGQLEAELAQNGWLTVDATPDLVFGVPDAGKWEAALRGLGVDALALSSAAGRA